MLQWDLKTEFQTKSLILASRQEKKTKGKVGVAKKYTRVVQDTHMVRGTMGILYTRDSKLSLYYINEL